MLKEISMEKSESYSSWGLIPGEVYKIDTEVVVDKQDNLHYNLNPLGIECWDAMEAMMSNAYTVPSYQGNLWGNIFKYIWRWPYKGTPLQDLKKARNYLDRLIDRVEKEGNK